MQDYTIWTENRSEADYASDKLDEIMELYGIGRNAVRVAVIPAGRCPFDTVYLNDKGLEELQTGFVIVEDQEG